MLQTPLLVVLALILFAVGYALTQELIAVDEDKSVADEPVEEDVVGEENAALAAQRMREPIYWDKHPETHPQLGPLQGVPTHNPACRNTVVDSVMVPGENELWRPQNYTVTKDTINEAFLRVQM